MSRPRTTRRRAAAPLLAAALLLGPALTACTADDPAQAGSTAPGGESAGTTDDGDAAAGSAGNDTPGSSGTGDSSAGDPGTADGGSDTGPGGDDTSADDDTGTADGSGGQTGGDGSEVVPAGPGRAPKGGLGRVEIPAAGHLDRDQPTGTAEGLVAGFPGDVVLVPEDATVTSSSVTRSERRYQVTLEASVDGACDPAVLDQRSWYTTGGFTETDAASGPDRTTVELTRADGTVRLDAAEARSGCTLILLAALTPR